MGLQPLRRTVVAVAGSAGCDAWPLVTNIPETFYMKPWDYSQFLLSPADETPEEPGDARPQEMEIARCIDQVNSATTRSIRHVRNSWAGHRTFAADRVPVVGFDTDVEGLFWCAALGGSGIQNAPAIAEPVGALLDDDDPSPELVPLVDPLSHGHAMRCGGYHTRPPSWCHSSIRCHPVGCAPSVAAPEPQTRSGSRRVRNNEMPTTPTP